MRTPYTCCPKCGHQPLPVDQSLPCACPGCGVILAKIGQPVQRPHVLPEQPKDDKHGWMTRLTYIPTRVDALEFWFRVATLAGLLVWGWVLIGLDYRTGDMGASFIHRPILVFHEAGLFGQIAHLAAGQLLSLVNAFAVVDVVTAARVWPDVAGVDAE